MFSVKISVDGSNEVLHLKDTALKLSALPKIAHNGRMVVTVSQKVKCWFPHMSICRKLFERSVERIVRHYVL